MATLGEFVEKFRLFCSLDQNESEEKKGVECRTLTVSEVQEGKVTGSMAGVMCSWFILELAQGPVLVNRDQFRAFIQRNVALRRYQWFSCEKAAQAILEVKGSSRSTDSHVFVLESDVVKVRFSLPVDAEFKKLIEPKIAQLVERIRETPIGEVVTTMTANFAVMAMRKNASARYMCIVDVVGKQFL